jgi:hypothetical protein
MKATVNDVVVEGTPEEIALLMAMYAPAKAPAKPESKFVQEILHDDEAYARRVARREAKAARKALFATPEGQEAALNGTWVAFKKANGIVDYTTM